MGPYVTMSTERVAEIVEEPQFSRSTTTFPGCTGILRET